MQDLFIGEPLCPESLDLGLRDRGGIPRDPLGVLQDRQRLGVEIRLSVVLSERLDQRIVFRFSTESLSVMDDSVMAPVDGRDDQGDHLPLGAS